LDLHAWRLPDARHDGTFCVDAARKDPSAAAEVRDEIQFLGQAPARLPSPGHARERQISLLRRPSAHAVRLHLDLMHLFALLSAVLVRALQAHHRSIASARSTSSIEMRPDLLRRIVPARTMRVTVIALTLSISAACFRLTWSAVGGACRISQALARQYT